MLHLTNTLQCTNSLGDTLVLLRELFGQQELPMQPETGINKVKKNKGKANKRKQDGDENTG